jgi:hypothetical protein
MHEAVRTGNRLRNGRETFLRGRHQGAQVSPKVGRTARGGWSNGPLSRVA